MEPRKQRKQIIQIEHIAKNPNWPEANQLAICTRGFELGATAKQIHVVVRAELEPGTAGFRVRRADHSTTLPSNSYVIRYFPKTAGPPTLTAVLLDLV